MTKDEIVTKVKFLNLPKNSYVVFGSCPLAAAGIRESGDIDLFVSEKLFTELHKKGWKILDKGYDDNPLVWDIFEAYKSWDYGSYNPTLEHLLSSATFIDGIPFVSLEEVRKWKTAFGRAKDLADIKLIDEYLSNVR